MLDRALRAQGELASRRSALEEALLRLKANLAEAEAVREEAAVILEEAGEEDDLVLRLEEEHERLAALRERADQARLKLGTFESAARMRASRLDQLARDRAAWQRRFDSAAAQLAKDARVPLYIYGVGIERPKNLTVGNIFAPEISFVKDEVPVTVRVRSAGIPNARISLKLVDPAGGEETVDAKDVSFDQDAEPAVSLKFRPEDQGRVHPQGRRRARRPAADDQKVVAVARAWRRVAHARSVSDRRRRRRRPRPAARPAPWSRSSG